MCICLHMHICLCVCRLTHLLVFMQKPRKDVKINRMASFISFCLIPLRQCLSLNLELTIEAMLIGQ